MKPYYQDEWVTIYHGDCREIMPELPDNSVDLVLTDPPYHPDYISYYEFLSELGLKLLKEGSYLCAYAGTMYLPDVIAALTKHLTWVWLFNLHHHEFTRIWMYQILQTSKPILAVSKGKPKPMHWLRTDLNPDGKAKQLHRWQQAEGIPALLISKLTEPKGIVLDPFLGSGTTAYCAKKLNRKSIGIEIEEKYCEISANRCRQTVMELEIK